VTGASRGIGAAIAKRLAKDGLHVVAVARSLDKLEQVVNEIKSEGGSAEPLACDIADAKALTETIEKVTETHGRLDVLVNNAGIMAVPLGRTADGFELQLGTNHLGHYALTGLVLPALLRAPQGRVVTVSSSAHRMARNRWDDPGWHTRRYRRWGAYARSKLANLLFVRELARRAAEAGTALVSVGAHPGYSSTHLVVATTEASGGRIGGPVMRASTRVLGQSDERGALPQLYAATMPDVQPGQYYGPEGPFELRGSPTLVGPSRAARDDDAARRLWDLSAELTGVSYDWGAAPAG
ncbi:MAG TPA: oxidoreductase, partial [Acidimicrobiales bacterium]